jgi:hypothetical protein
MADGNVEPPMMYVAPDAKKGRTQGFFAAAHGFRSMEKGPMKALVRVVGDQ